jgi:hypothetical protein
MSGLFEHIEMFDEGDKVATRQAIAVANKRFNDTFAGFLRQASSEKEFNGRLALVEQDIANMAADVANEYGGDAEKIAKAVSSTVKAAFGPTPPADEAPMCENCGGHGCKDCTGDPEAARTASESDAIWDEATTKFVRMHPEEVAPGTPAEQIPSEAYETAKYHIDQDKDTILASVTSHDVDSVMKAIEQWFNQHFRTASKDRPEHLKAQDEVQLADEHSQVAPWLKKQIQDEDQEDGGNLRNKEAAAHTVEKKGDKFFVVEDEGEEAAGPFDSQEEAYARANELNDLENLETEETHKEGSVTPAMAKALQLKQAAKPDTGDSTEENESLPTGNEDAHDGPSPKIDKTKWKPNATNPDGNLKPIETEGKNSPHPTRHMDIKDKPDYQQDTLENLKQYDNKVWDREQLPTAKGDEAGFEGTRNIDQPTKAAETFPNKNQADPVTNISLPQALADKTSAWYDEDSLFRSWLSDHGIALTDDPEDLKESPAVRALWKQFVQDVPSPEKGEELMGAPSNEPIIDEGPIEEEIEIEEAPEDVEEIIEREDDEGDRVEVIHDHDEDEDEDEDLEFEDSFDDEDDEIERLQREIRENPDDWQ